MNRRVSPASIQFATEDFADRHEPCSLGDHLSHRQIRGYSAPIATCIDHNGDPSTPAQQSERKGLDRALDAHPEENKFTGWQLGHQPISLGVAQQIIGPFAKNHLLKRIEQFNRATKGVVHLHVGAMAEEGELDFPLTGGAVDTINRSSVAGKFERPMRFDRGDDGGIIAFGPCDHVPKPGNELVRVHDRIGAVGPTEIMLRVDIHDDTFVDSTISMYDNTPPSQ